MVKRKVVHDIEGCFGCPMAKLFPTNTFVEPKLGTNNRVIVAEAPGEQESLEGEPLVGGAGKVAKQLYSKAGIAMDDCTKLNIIQCRPPRNEFPDSPEARKWIGKDAAQTAIKQCLKNHVKPILESKRWERLDILGSVPLKYLSGLEGGITRWRGSIIEVDTSKLGE